MDGQNFNNEQQTQFQGQPVYQQPQSQPVYQQEQPVYQQPQSQPVYQQPVYQQQYVAAPAQDPNKAHGLSVAGLVIGIVSIVLCCLNWVAVLIGVVGLILAIIGQVKRKSKLGIAAIIVSAVGIALGIIIVVVALSALSSGAYYLNDLFNYYY